MTAGNLSIRGLHSTWGTPHKATFLVRMLVRSSHIGSYSGSICRSGADQDNFGASIRARPSGNISAHLGAGCTIVCRSHVPYTSRPSCALQAFLVVNCLTWAADLNRNLVAGCLIGLTDTLQLGNYSTIHPRPVSAGPCTYAASRYVRTATAQLCWWLSRSGRLKQCVSCSNNRSCSGRCTGRNPAETSLMAAAMQHDYFRCRSKPIRRSGNYGHSVALALVQR